MQDGEAEGKEEFAIVFAAMGVNMETAHYFKQVNPLLKLNSITKLASAGIENSGACSTCMLLILQL